MYIKQNFLFRFKNKHVKCESVNGSYMTTYMYLYFPFATHLRYMIRDFDVVNDHFAIFFPVSFIVYCLRRIAVHSSFAHR